MAFACLADPKGRLAIELNRLEPQGQSCVAYLVFRNETGTSLESLRLELALFGVDGFIARRFTLDAAPIPAGKTSLKLFEIAATPCETLGRVLINEVLACAGPNGVLADCLERIEPSSRLPVSLFK